MRGGVERARQAFAERAWSAVVEALGSDAALSDDPGALEPDDLERFAIAAYLVGEDADADRAMRRAHQAWLGAGELDGAGRCAFWIGIYGLLRGDEALASGWFGRGRRVIATAPPPCAARGYLMIPDAMEHLAAGDTGRADDIYRDVMAVADACGDSDLIAIGLLGRGETAVAAGDLGGGLALLDEAMIMVITDQLSPLAVGILYCAVLDACMQALDMSRAREWTAAFSRWCEGQPDLVPFRGECLVHRSQVMQSDGRWGEATRFANDATDRLADPPHPAAGAASYQRGELHRLRGEHADADRCYRAASELGRDPVPGLALLRLGQGRIDAAVATAHRMLDEAIVSAARLAVLPAVVEVMLAAGDIDAAREARDELIAFGEATGSIYVDALAAHAVGAVSLAEAAPDAGAVLRRAMQLWHRLGMPYEAARSQELVGLAYRAAGDRDTGDLELDSARTAFARLGAAPDAARVAEHLASGAVGSVGGTGGGRPLTEREREVLRLVAAGCTNREIGTELLISEHTAARHVQNIFTKIGVSSRAAATAYAYEHEIV